MRIVANRTLLLTYSVEPADDLALPEHRSERADGLWRNTCFELFAKVPGEAAYREFNFAPPGAWNAYSFCDWRKGMAQIDLPHPPNLIDCRLDERKRRFPGRFELDVVLGPGSLPLAATKISVTAVIEEVGGTLSYWALAHPPGEPDFHHPACFVAKLPPPTRP